MGRAPGGTGPESHHKFQGPRPRRQLRLLTERVGRTKKPGGINRRAMVANVVL